MKIRRDPRGILASLFSSMEFDMLPGLMRKRHPENKAVQP